MVFELLQLEQVLCGIGVQEGLSTGAPVDVWRGGGERKGRRGGEETKIIMRCVIHDVGP